MKPIREMTTEELAIDAYLPRGTFEAHEAVDELARRLREAEAARDAETEACAKACDEVAGAYAIAKEPALCRVASALARSIRDRSALRRTP